MTRGRYAATLHCMATSVPWLNVHGISNSPPPVPFLLLSPRSHTQPPSPTPTPSTMPKDINGSKNIGKSTLGRSLSRSKNKSRQQQKDALRKARQSDKRQNYSVGGFTSVTEINSLDDFIISAEMADHEFAVERQNVVVIAGLTRATIKPDDKGDQLEHMTVPRRPAWNKAMTAEEVDHQEKVCAVCVCAVVVLCVCGGSWALVGRWGQEVEEHAIGGWVG